MRIRAWVLGFGVSLLAVAAVIAAVPFRLPDSGVACPATAGPGIPDPSCPMGPSVHHFGIAGIIGGVGVVVLFVGML